jgi:hypothetical protein
MRKKSSKKRPARGRGATLKKVVDTEAAVLINNLMEQLANSLSWRTASGTKVLIAKMTDSHIANALYYMDRAATLFATGEMGFRAADPKAQPLIKYAVHHLYGDVYKVMEWERQRRVQRMVEPPPLRAPLRFDSHLFSPDRINEIPQSWAPFLRGNRIRSVGLDPL